MRGVIRIPEENELPAALLEASDVFFITKQGSVGVAESAAVRNRVKEPRLRSAGLTLGGFRCAPATRISGTLEVRRIASIGFPSLVQPLRRHRGMRPSKVVVVDAFPYNNALQRSVRASRALLAQGARRTPRR